MKKALGILGWTLVLAALTAVEAKAHNLGDSYLYLQIYEDTVTGRFEVALSDLNPALGLSGTEREITRENLDEHIDFLRSYYLDHVTISNRGRSLDIEFREHDFLDARGGFVLMPFDFGGLDGVPDKLSIEYTVLFGEEPGHRGFLLVEHNWATGTFANENRVSLVFTPSSPRQEFDLTSSGRLRGFLALAGLGAEHMLGGLDHILFLVALLLTAVLVRENGTWSPLPTVRPAAWKLFQIVTAFLAAHTVALTLAALGLLRLPERLVETAIAGSTALAAANILIPLFPRIPVLRDRLWWIVFVLALFHGLGFAAALLDLGVVEEHLGLSVLAFNLGVEAGQIAIAAVLFPVLFLARKLRLYRMPGLPVAAVAILLVSGVWVAERGFGIDIPMRELLPEAVRKVIP